jgi:AraC-like DNA-binding protein
MFTHGERVIGDSVCPFGEMDLVMTGPNVLHAWRGEIVEGNHVITIQFTESFLGMSILDKRLFAPIKQLLVDSKRGICFSQSSTLLLKDKIIRLTQTKGFQSVLEFLSILYNLAIAEYSILTTNQYNTADVVMTSKSRRIAKVCDYIEKKCYDSISLAEVSSLVGMSESAFSHFFKKKTGGTFIDYLNNLRIAKACQLLAETSNTIAEICYSSGFNNISNFIRMFKKRKGVTPNEYRTMMNQMLIKY